MKIGLRGLRTVLILSCLSAGWSAAAQAVPFMNGSFETATANPGITFVTLGGGNTQVSGWTVTGGNVDYIGGLWTAADGSRSFDLNGSTPGAISQTFDTIAGHTYQFTFALAGNPFREFEAGTGPLRHLRVSVGGTIDNYTFDTAGRTPTDMGWIDGIFTFVAAGSSSTVVFSSTTGAQCCHGPAIDNIRLADITQTSNVPEPGTLVLLAGVAGLLRFCRQALQSPGDRSPGRFPFGIRGF